MAPPKHIYAWLICGFATLGAWLYGYDGVYFTGVVALGVFVKSFGTLQPDGTYSIRPSDLSAMTSMIQVGELVGSLGSAPINDYLGRKGAWIVGSLFVTIGVVLQLVTSSSQAIISGGRAVLGFGVGAFCATSPLYIARILVTEWSKQPRIDHDAVDMRNDDKSDRDVEKVVAEQVVQLRE
ncbi:unnamed protein product [Clonostachys solani]|uniref:Major facilitator superfamily (MFS) profile domain-containing protein n=1 Tax=Clonostachys solani TaxID=160281 RepID=A0A9N9Z0I5_9HYPO|nr:unnamed protein product [Clonostachys solani]